MSTLTTPASIVKPNVFIKGAAGSASYAIEVIPAGEFGTSAVRMTKRTSGESYDLIRTHSGALECSCPDWVCRHADHGTACKHLRSALALGLLPEAFAPISGGSPEAAVLEAPVVKPVPPVTRKDVARSRAFGISLPKVAPAAPAVQEFVPEPPPVAEVPALASDDESTGIDLDAFTSRTTTIGDAPIEATGPMAWKALTPSVSVLENRTPVYVDYRERNARLDAIEAEARQTNVIISAELDAIEAARVEVPVGSMIARGEVLPDGSYSRSTATRPADRREVASWLSSRPVSLQERPTRFQPTPEDQQQAALLFADPVHSCLAGESGPAIGDRSYPSRKPRARFNGISDTDLYRPGAWS